MQLWDISKPPMLICAQAFVLEVFCKTDALGHRRIQVSAAARFAQNRSRDCLVLCVLLLDLWSHTVSMVINYHRPGPLWGPGVSLPRTFSPPCEHCSSQVLKDKALLCSPTADGTISSVRASVTLLFFFFPFALVLSLLVLPRLRNSVDHTLGICLSLLENKLTSDFWKVGLVSPCRSMIDTPSAYVLIRLRWVGWPICLYYSAGPIIQNKPRLHICVYWNYFHKDIYNNTDTCCINLENNSWIFAAWQSHISN